MTMEQLPTNEPPYEVGSEHGLVSLDESAQNLLAQLQNNTRLSGKQLSGDTPDPEEEELDKLKRALLLDEETSLAEDSTIPSLPSFAESLPILPESQTTSNHFNPNSVPVLSSNVFSKQLSQEPLPNGGMVMNTTAPNFPLYNSSLSINSVPLNLSAINHNVAHSHFQAPTSPPQNLTGLPLSVPFSYNNLSPGLPNYYINGNMKSNAPQKMEQSSVPFPLPQLHNGSFTATNLPKPQITTNGVLQAPTKPRIFPNGLTISNETPISSPVTESRPKRVDTPSTPIIPEEPIYENSFIKDGKQYHINDFIILRPNPNLNDNKICIAQLIKFTDRDSRTFAGMMYKFADQLRHILKEPTRPREVLRTLLPIKFTISDVIDRCHILPEPEFVKLSPEFVDLHKIFLLRYRYHEKKNQLVKARNLHLLLRSNIKELNLNGGVKPEHLNSKKVRFSVSEQSQNEELNQNQTQKQDHSQIQNQYHNLKAGRLVNPAERGNFIAPTFTPTRPVPPQTVSSIPYAPEFSISTDECTGFLSEENRVLLPCDGKNNVKWFTTPPLPPPPPSLEVAHSLDYLVYLAKKRKASTSNP